MFYLVICHKTVHRLVIRFSCPQWGTVDAESKVPLQKTQSQSTVSHSIALHASTSATNSSLLVSSFLVHSTLFSSKSSPCFLTAWNVANTVSPVGLQNKTDHPAHHQKPLMHSCRFQFWKPTNYINAGFQNLFGCIITVEVWLLLVWFDKFCSTILEYTCPYELPEMFLNSCNKSCWHTYICIHSRHMCMHACACASVCLSVCVCPSVSV